MTQSELRDCLKLLGPNIRDFVGKHATMTFDQNPKSVELGPHGGIQTVTTDSVLGWARASDGNVCVSIHADFLGTDGGQKRELLDHLFKAITVIARAESNGLYDTHNWVSLVSSAFDLAVGRFVRKREEDHRHVQTLIALFKNLTAKRYEGGPCLSAALFLKDLGDLESMHWHPLVPLKVDGQFFEQTLSYRLINGENAVYVIDDQLMVRGILVLEGKEECLLDEGLRRLLEKKNGSFLIRSNRNQTVQIFTGETNMLTWNRSTWGLCEFGKIEAIVKKHLTSGFQTLVDVVARVSAGRQGALILIAKEASWEKITESRTDKSELGQTRLEPLMREMNLVQANESGLLVPALTSDGMTILDANGMILGVGRLVSAHTASEASGGGRSQAARSISNHGLAIKISADGPIEIYEKQRIVLAATT